MPTPTTDHDTTVQPDPTPLTRRNLLRSGAVMAAALGLPLSTKIAEAADQSDPTIIHLAECFHAKSAAPDEHTEQADAAWDVLMDASPEVREVAWAHGLESGAAWINETDRFVEELCRHFAGLAPAIRAVAYHLNDQATADRGVCCSGDDPAA